MSPVQDDSGARTMRIAHVDAEPGFSGGEVQVFLLMEGLRERGHAALLVCPPGSESERVARERGFEVACVSMRTDLDLPAVSALRRVFEQAQVELVHLHTSRATWLGGLAAHWAKLPALSTRRMDRPVAPSLKTRTIYGRLVRRVAGISPAVCECLRRGGVPASSIVLIRSSVDPEVLRPERGRQIVREELGAVAGDVVALTLAALVRRKGLDLLLEALAQPSGPQDLRVWIAGEGPERAALEAQAVELGLVDRVQFLGKRHDKADLLAACDLFVMPSRAEGLGVAALEAMAASRPVIASRVGGLADLVLDGRNGRLVPAEDVRALAVALRELVDDSDRRARWGAAGPERVRAGFLASQMVQAYEGLYREILEQGAQG